MARLQRHVRQGGRFERCLQHGFRKSLYQFTAFVQLGCNKGCADGQGGKSMSQLPTEVDKKGYWRAVVRLTLSLLVIWFAVSYGAGILFRDLLDNFSIGGAPLGFWFAQNGAIYVFVVLIFYYCRAMNRLEKKYGVGV
tara:strand:- start:2060 stop:2473 length:414 start_codon:yes stop_codon:yes gene_type:complete